MHVIQHGSIECDLFCICTKKKLGMDVLNDIGEVNECDWKYVRGKIMIQFQCSSNVYILNFNCMWQMLIAKCTLSIEWIRRISNQIRKKKLIKTIDSTCVHYEIPRKR